MREITHREHIARVNAQSDTVVVEAVRTARLDDTLTTITARRFDCIVVHAAPFTGSDRDASTLRLSRDAAMRLHDALAAALDATEGDPTIWVRDNNPTEESA